MTHCAVELRLSTLENEHLFDAESFYILLRIYEFP
jgi:hypothetical protein